MTALLITDEQPRLMGNGPPTFSTSLEMVVPYRMVWDTNGYYRELGVSPWATRREIREAYQEREGWKSTRLTYILTVLLDPEARASYDRTPLGSFKVDDFILEMWHRERVKEVVKLRAQGLIHEAQELSDEDPDWWIDFDEIVSQPPRRMDPDGYDAWPWGFYLWGRWSRDGDEWRLREWQELLISALGERKEHHEIAIGLCQGMGPWGVRTVGYRLVAFLGDEEQPTEALARAAASRVVEHDDIRRSINNVRT